MKNNNFKKLDVVMRYFLPVTAGIEINVWQTYKALAKAGWDITIHVTRDTYTEKNILPESEIIDGLKIKRYKYRSLGFKPEIDWNKTDGVCLHNFDIFPHFWILTRALFLKWLGKKNFALYVTPHGGFSPEWSVFSFAERLIKRTYTYTIGVFLLNRAVDGVRSVSPWEAEEMSRLGVKDGLVQVITNGLENEAYLNVDSLASENIKNTISDIKTYIMDNSRLKPIKDVETTIRTLALLPENIHFVHIGTTQDIKYRESLIKLSDSLGLKERVHFLGVVRGIDKYYLYKHATVFVHPAIWEANANVVHEAWSQRLITIVGDSTGMRAQVKNKVNGFLVPLRNPKALSDLIIDAIEAKDSKFADSLRDANMEYVKTHAWKDVGMRMGEFYLSRMKNGINSKLDYSSVLSERIDSIIKNKIPCYFVSPHLDDAVFSAGSLITHLSKHTEVNVVSVFTESSSHKTLSIRAFLSQCGIKDPESLFLARRSEDKKVCEEIGAKAIHLGFIDAPWRTKAVGKLRNIISKILPELSSVYATHRWHIAKGKISLSDSNMINKIKDSLVDLIIKNQSGKFAVFGPSAIGNHVDHVITRDVCRDLFLNAIYFADVPYILNNPEAINEVTLGEIGIWAGDLKNKENIIRGYKTQFKAMFGGGSPSLPQEIFYIREIIEKKPKVSVGIPAYNEEGNIKVLLEAILAQKEINHELLEVLVVSDGSSDKTIKLAKSIGSSKIKIFDYRKRRGAMIRQNEVHKIFNGDILVLLNADVLPKDNYYIENMILPFLRSNKIGLVSNRGTTMPAETFVEKIINFSVSMKVDILEIVNGGDNIYLCHGHSRSFSRSFAKSVKWPEDATAEDAFSYLRAKELGFEFFYQKNAEIYFRSPQNIFDHIKQSSRFINSKKGLSKYFDKKIIDKNFKLPATLVALICIESFLRHPILFVSYIWIRVIATLDSLVINRATVAWDPSSSSKILIK